MFIQDQIDWMIESDFLVLVDNERKIRHFLNAVHFNVH